MSRFESGRAASAFDADSFRAPSTGRDEPASSPGVTLRHLVQRLGPLPPDRAVRIIARAARVLAEAHSAGTVHGELTPDDVILTTIGGERDYVQLPELGAEREPGHVPDSDFTTPEAAGGFPCDVRSDLYSLGALLFFALTGRPPYEGSERDRLRAQLFAPPPSVAGISPHRVSRVLDAFVRRCLMKNPTSRPETADDLASTLLAIPAIEPPLPSDQETAARVRRARLWGRGWPVMQARRAFQFDTATLGASPGLTEGDLEDTYRRRPDPRVSFSPPPPSLDGLPLEMALDLACPSRLERETLPPPPVHVSTLPPPSPAPRRILGAPCIATLPSPAFTDREVRTFSRRNTGSTPPTRR